MLALQGISARGSRPHFLSGGGEPLAQVLDALTPVSYNVAYGDDR
jgi:hypothetical protein